MNTRRVLFVDHAGVLGGAELSLLDVASGLGERTAVVLLSDGPFREALEERGVAVTVQPLGAMSAVKKASIAISPGAAFDVWRNARRLAGRAEATDVIYANSQKAFVVAALAGDMAGRPVIWHLRDILGPPHFSAVTTRVGIWLANRYAARVIVNSAATGRAFVVAGGNESLVRVVYNGVDPAPFDAAARGPGPALRAELGVPPGAIVAVHVGRFHPWKGQQVLLRALVEAPGVHAWFVGAPLFGEHRFAADLCALAATLGVAERTRFLGFREDVPAILSAADLVVHSSVFPEPFGRVIVEGMLAGKPVIAANAGGVAEIVTDGETGFLVPPDDPAALANALHEVVREPARAARIAARGCQHARSEFSVEAMVGGVRAVLETL